MDVQELNDDELLAQAREWRTRALRGEKDARGIAHELEREVRHRFGVPKAAPLAPWPQTQGLNELPQSSPRRWRPW